MVLLVALCPVCGAVFSGFPKECTKLLQSAWGSPVARKAALKGFADHDQCPHTDKVSSRGRAALIAANLAPDPSDACYDASLSDAVRAACGSSWQTLFSSNSWHPHGEGTLLFHEPAVAGLIAALVFLYTLYIILLIRNVKSPGKDKTP